uniref:Uncharacterized protein n=1 Tax=Monopterus albus TaxID=43700 RepID=A0A3Q3R758_MONAL
PISAIKAVKRLKFTPASLLPLSWDLKIKKKLKTVPLCLGKLRPVVGQRCHQCTPDSLVSKFEKNYSLGFHNLLSVNETDTRYRGWLARRMCCALFVSGCKVYVSPVNNRLDRICQKDSSNTAAHVCTDDKTGNISMPTHVLQLFVGWVMLKMLPSVFGSIQVNLNHMVALQRASQEGSLLVYVYVRQSIMDCALIPLVLFCQNLRVPYTLCPLQINSSFLRSILQKVGVVLLPPSALTEQDAETDRLYAPVMTSLVRELLHEGQAISVGVSAKSGQGGQWLAHIRQLIKEGSVPDVSLVPVGISYDSLPTTNIQVDACKHTLAHLLREMCESWRNRVDEWLPLQDLLLPVILNNSLSALCRDVVWLTEEVLLKNKDVGFGGSLAEVVHHSLSLLTPHLIIAAVPSRKDPFIIPRPSLAASLHLNLQAHIVRHTFILEAVGACAVSAMLCEVAIIRGDMEFDVVLCQSELTERALQLCHLLPPGFMPPCQSSHSFALDAIDSLVRCGILVMEEIPRGVPVCDFWKKEGALSWTTSDDPYHSDSDCGEEELHSYRVMKTQPRQCPEMLFFFCSMLAGHLRTLCWTVKGLDLINTPLPGMFKG